MGKVKNQIKIAKPFLRWPGGKRWLLPILRELIGDFQADTYFEPFLGGGALFFDLAPKSAVLSDTNIDLIKTYKSVKKMPKLLIDNLRDLPINSKTFENLRQLSEGTQIQRAIRLLYLNRTCFSGLYRVNRMGKFNVPYAHGTRTTNILINTDLLLVASKRLKNAQLFIADFEESILKATVGDLIYCDPTYTVKHDNNGFRRYNETLFSWDDQERLARCCGLASNKGVRVIISNAFHKDILELFSHFNSIVVERNSCLSATPQYRDNVKELLFFNWEM